MLAAFTGSHNSREVYVALLDQWVDDIVHDGHQNQDQNGVDSLVGGNTPSVVREKKQFNKEMKTEAKKSLTCICSGWISIAPCDKRRRERQSERSFKHVSERVTGVSAEGLQICRPWWSPGASIWSPAGEHSRLLTVAPTNSKINGDAGGHLLIKESPEHGQRDVQEQNLEHHLDLCDQKFLGGQREEEEVNGCLVLSSSRGGNTYIILLLGPVHPVSPLRVMRSTVAEAVLDGKLQMADRTLLD